MTRVDPATATVATIERVAPDLVARTASISTATLHEAAARTGDLPHAIKPACAGFVVAGPAVTVACPNGDNLWIHRAIYVAQPGDVLVVAPGPGVDFGYWGEVMSTAALARGLSGLVIDGCVRDVRLLRDVGFPVFARGLCIRGTVKDATMGGWINTSIRIGDAVIRPGDLIIGDEDGVVAIPHTDAATIIAAAEARDAMEAAMCDQLRSGRTTLELLNLQ